MKEKKKVKIRVGSKVVWSDYDCYHKGVISAIITFDDKLIESSDDLYGDDIFVRIGDSNYYANSVINVLSENSQDSKILSRAEAGGGDFVIPQGVTEIGAYAFADCEGLTSIEIPNSVTEIDNCAFEGCTGLTSVKIPDSVVYIGDSAFYGCTGLTSVEMSNSIIYIGNEAFSGCKSLTIRVPRSCQIGNDAFEGVKEVIYY